MAYKNTEAQRRAEMKYKSKTVAVQIRMTEEKREEVRKAAIKEEMSLAQYIIEAIDERMKMVNLL